MFVPKTAFTNGVPQLDRQSGPNKAVVCYGHKEKPKKAKEPPEAPFLVLGAIQGVSDFRLFVFL